MERILHALDERFMTTQSMGQLSSCSTSLRSYFLASKDYWSREKRFQKQIQEYQETKQREAEQEAFEAEQAVLEAQRAALEERRAEVWSENSSSDESSHQSFRQWWDHDTDSGS